MHHCNTIGAKTKALKHVCEIGPTNLVIGFVKINLEKQGILATLLRIGQSLSAPLEQSVKPLGIRSARVKAFFVFNLITRCLREVVNLSEEKSSLAMQQRSLPTIFHIALKN